MIDPQNPNAYPEQPRVVTRRGKEVSLPERVGLPTSPR